MDTALFPELEGYRSTVVCELSGLTYRQLDYYARIGVMVPSIVDGRGNGSRRIYSAADVVRASLAFELRDHGMMPHLIGKVLSALDPEPSSWPEYLFVSAAGEIRQFGPQGSVWWGISTRRLLAACTARCEVASRRSAA